MPVLKISGRYNKVRESRKVREQTKAIYQK